MQMAIHLYSDSVLYGGAEHYLTLLARGLRQRGHDVIVLMRGDSALDRWAEVLQRNQIKVIRGLSTLGLTRWLRITRPDVLHVNMPSPYSAGCGIIAPLAKFVGVKKVVTTEHLPGSVGSVRFRLKKRISGKWVDAIITETKTNVRYLTDLHGIDPKRVVCIYHGVDIERYPNKTNDETCMRLRQSLGFKNDDVLIALIGRLHPQKGHDYLLQAAALLKERHPDCRYLFIGDGDWRADLEALVRQLSLQDRVNFLGFREDILDLLQIIDILAMPSRTEGLPFVLLEAMAVGLPVVTSDLACLTEVVTHGENGFLVPSGNTQALANTLDFLLQNRGLWVRVGQKARETVVNRFRLEVMLDQTEGFYARLLTGKAGRREKCRKFCNY